MAQEQLEALQRLNHLGSLDRTITFFEQRLDSARNAQLGSKVTDSSLEAEARAID
jgi:hypothetical protein